MTKDYCIHHSLNSLFFNPLEQVYQDSDQSYTCSSISDLEFAKLGILRCLSHTKTGHQFLQHHADHTGRDIEPSHFFKTLKSQRRLTNITSLNELLRTTMKRDLPDPFATFKELENYDIYAADGHYHHAAAFDPKPASSTGKAYATGHFFRLDLRSHHLGHLDLGVPDDGKKRTHDITIIRRANKQALRNNAPKGRKILYAWDKACIDYQLWSRLKNTAGIYFLTREKSNSTATLSSINLVDHSDRRNAGIESDHYVSPSNGDLLRRIIYTDPADKTTYTYLTNEMKLPAHQLVIIYKQRWDVEKVFHQLKSKMEERKSWASSQTAKRHHALFECLAHNLCLLVEAEVKSRGMKDEVEEKKATGRQATRRNRMGESMGKADNYISQFIQRATQRTARFIRWLQGALYHPAPLDKALSKLHRVWSLQKT